MTINGYTVPPGILLDQDDERVAARLKACLTHPLASTFTGSLERLAGMTKGRGGTSVELALDFAPLSWVFTVILPDGRPWLHGGLIIHASHDGYGSGGTPTFSVSLAGDAGWQLHT